MAILHEGVVSFLSLLGCGKKLGILLRKLFRKTCEIIGQFRKISENFEKFKKPFRKARDTKRMPWTWPGRFFFRLREIKGVEFLENSRKIHEQILDIFGK